MQKKIYKLCIRIAAFLCAVSLFANIFDLNIPIKGAFYIDIVFIAIWLLSEWQWHKERVDG